MQVIKFPLSHVAQACIWNKAMARKAGVYYATAVAVPVVSLRGVFIGYRNRISHKLP